MGREGGRGGRGKGETGWIVCQRRRANRVFDLCILRVQISGWRDRNWVKSCSIVSIVFVQGEFWKLKG